MAAGQSQSRKTGSIRGGVRDPDVRGDDEAITRLPLRRLRRLRCEDSRNFTSRSPVDNRAGKTRACPGVCAIQKHWLEEVLLKKETNEFLFLFPIPSLFLLLSLIRIDLVHTPRESFCFQVGRKPLPSPVPDYAHCCSMCIYTHPVGEPNDFLKSFCSLVTLSPSPDSSWSSAVSFFLYLYLLLYTAAFFTCPTSGAQ